MKLLVAGDYFPSERIAELLIKEQYSDVFPKDIVTLFHSVDYSLVNLECPIINGSCEPILKCGINLGCASGAIDALRYLGVSCVTLANNHIMDYGREGMVETLKTCKAQNIDVVGGGVDIYAAGEIRYVKKSGQTVAIINCCESEFSIAFESCAGANPLNPIRQYNAIQDAKSRADYVVVIVHGGHEHFQLPSTRMQDTYRFFIDAGADVVLNHHQHCFSGYEIYKEKPIFYGIGNFCFDEKVSVNKELFVRGYLVHLELEDTISFKLYPYIQCDDKATVKLLPTDSFNETLESLNEIIRNRCELIKANQANYINSNVDSYIEPIQNRYLRALQTRGFFPSFITKRFLIKLYNVVNCESHRDRLLYFIQRKISN